MSAPYSYIQLDYLEKMAGGDPGTRRELLLMLARELETSAPRLNTLWAQNKRAELQQLCHHLKTTFPFVGNSRLASLNRQMEQHLLQELPMNRLYPILLEMGHLISKSLQELRRELEKS